MVKFILFFSIIFNSFVWADQVSLELVPKKPVVGEVFQLIFKISSDSSSEPSINFNPGNMEVSGKFNQGISTRTVYANGKLSVSREVIISYDLVASKAGTDFIREIKVDIDGKTITHPSFPVTVIKEPEEIPDIFVMADVPKKEIYVGEGIVVRYFLYSKASISSIDIKKYPKLDKFLKRFIQEPDRIERVSVDGEIYLRSQIYAAKLFSEKVGEFKIDPISLSATYNNSRNGDPFGVFGLSRNLRTKNLTSETVKIISLPLPTPVPKGFTGLVGKHDIQLQFGKSKLIVNEPLQIKLIVTGVGALENLDPPLIFESDAFEEFESNGDLKISDADQATKTFEYTFLAKKNVSLPSADKEIFTFNPETKSYESIKLQIPEIQVAGGSAFNDNETSRKKNETQENSSLNSAPPSSKVTKEEFQLISGGSHLRIWLNWINLSIVLGMLITLFIIFLLKELPKFHFKKDSIPKDFKKGEFSLSEFLRWISPLVQYFGKSPKHILESSSLDDESREYFLKLLENNESQVFSKEKKQFKFTYNSKHFKNLQAYIETIENEANTKFN